MTTGIPCTGVATLAGIVLGAAAASEPSDHNAELAAPFAVEAIARIPESGSGRERPQQSNQYSWFGDFDGDGRPDLLMGDTDPETKPGRGRLRIYRNAGSASDPRFEAPFWFHDLCPTGFIPWG